MPYKEGTGNHNRHPALLGPLEAPSSLCARATFSYTVSNPHTIPTLESKSVIHSRWEWSLQGQLFHLKPISHSENDTPSPALLKHESLICH